MPVDCTLGEDCFLQQFVDHDPGPGVQDFSCGLASYNGHKGTDIRISYKDMRAGVNVLAPASGRVRAVRDGMPDVVIEDPATVAGRGCGNAVVVDHGGGWSSQLCHLQRGSVGVAPGDTLEAGQIVGRIGLSGNTQFPHLDMTLRKDDKIVDPFAPDLAGGTCGSGLGQPLWASNALVEEAQNPGRLIATGIADRAPTFGAVLDGVFDDILPMKQAPIVFWAVVINGRVGDQLLISASMPNGLTVKADPKPLARNQAQLFRFSGKRPPQTGWPSGVYRWTAELVRKGRVIDRRTGQVTLNN